MSTVVIAAGIWLGVVLLLVRIVNRWAAYQIRRSVDNSFSAADYITDQKRVPVVWRAPYEKRIREARRQGASEAQLARLGEQAKQHFDRNIASVITFFEKEGFTDNPDTRRLLLRTLQEQRESWAREEWQALLDLTDNGG